MKRDEVVYEVVAQRERDEVIEYIAARNFAAALRLDVEIDAVLDLLARGDPPVDGTAVRLRSGRSCRQWFVHPVTIYYDRAPGRVIVLHVRHHARAPITQ